MRIQRLAGPIAVAASLVALACATKFPFMPSSASPAAAGEVHAKIDDNGNAWVELELEHLALPGTLAPARSTYVMQTDYVEAGKGWF